MNTTASNARLHKMVGCALFAALTAVCSQLAIPMPWGVPINLALFAVYMAGTMLGPVWGAASQLVYLLLAAVGVPVMAGMQGGPAVLLGKTGGYAIGYLLAALIAGAFAAKLPRKFGWLALGCVVGPTEQSFSLPSCFSQWITTPFLSMPLNHVSCLFTN